MTDREKLIELLDDIQLRGENFTEYEIYGMRLPNTVSNEDVADHLIANGVTFATDKNVGHFCGGETRPCPPGDGCTVKVARKVNRRYTVRCMHLEKN